MTARAKLLNRTQEDPLAQCPTCAESIAWYWDGNVKRLHFHRFAESVGSTNVIKIVPCPGRYTIVKSTYKIG